MGHYSVSKRVRRRKVADIATKSRMYSVNNCTIQNIDGNTETKTVDGITYTVGKRLKWKKEHHKQPKPLYHSHFVTIKGERKKVKSQFPDICSTKLTRKELIQLYIKEKIKKWERKHPCPAKDDDLFKEEFIPKWKKEREEALEHFRDFVVSVYHKLKIVGYKVDYENRSAKPGVVAKVKDEDMKGHHVKYPNLQTTDKLWKKATNAAREAMDNDSEILDCDLLNHKETEKRPLYEAKRHKRAA